MSQLNEIKQLKALAEDLVARGAYGDYYAQRALLLTQDDRELQRQTGVDSGWVQMVLHQTAINDVRDTLQLLFDRVICVSFEHILSQLNRFGLRWSDVDWTPEAVQELCAAVSAEVAAGTIPHLRSAQNKKAALN